MATYRHTNVGAAVATTDYARADQVQNGSMQYLSSVAGTDTITATATPTPAAYAAGQTFRFVSAGANTGAVTLNISSLGAKSVTKFGSTALSAGDIPSGAAVEVVYDGTRFQLINVNLSYAPPTSGSAILKGNGSGGFSSAVSGTDYQAPIGTISGIAKGNGANALTAATAGTDYVAPGTNTTFTKAQRGAFVTLTDAATIAIDASAGNFFRVQLGGNRTLGVPTNLVEGQSGQIDVYQDGTGSRTLAYSWCYQFAAGTAPTLTTGKYTRDVLAYTVDVYQSATVTISNATPGVVTWTGHGLLSGQQVQFTTTGGLPTGLSASTSYWITVIDANTFKVSTSFANAQAGTFVNTSSAGSGTHTCTAATITVSAIGDCR